MTRAAEAGRTEMTVHYDLYGEVALIRLDNPPMNGLSLATRQAAVKALEQARQDPEVRAVVLMPSSSRLSVKRALM